jgi:hypothetical protein
MRTVGKQMNPFHYDGYGDMDRSVWPGFNPVDKHLISNQVFGEMTNGTWHPVSRSIYREIVSLIHEDIRENESEE